MSTERETIQRMHVEIWHAWYHVGIHYGQEARGVCTMRINEASREFKEIKLLSIVLLTVNRYKFTVVSFSPSH